MASPPPFGLACSSLNTGSDAEGVQVHHIPNSFDAPGLSLVNDHSVHGGDSCEVSCCYNLAVISSQASLNTLSPVPGSAVAE